MSPSDGDVRMLAEKTIGRHPEGREIRDVSGHHPSHAILRCLEATAAGDPCLIEPAVQCNHCGYCQSYGH